MSAKIEPTQCKIQLRRGTDYIVRSYRVGDFKHVSYDFIILKGEGIEKNKEIAPTNYETVYQDFDVIINTRSASLSMTIYTYPKCEVDKVVTHQQDGTKSMELRPGMCTSVFYIWPNVVWPNLVFY